MGKEKAKLSKFLRWWNCEEEGHNQHPKPKGMVNYGRESLANVNPKQKLAENHHSPSVIKVARFQQNSSSLVVNGKVCGRNCQIVVDTGTGFTIVRPDIVKRCRISDTGEKFILKTAGGDTMSVLEIHEAKIQLGQHEFNHLVLLANITDKVLMGLDLMRLHKFHLDLENSVIKTNRKEFSVKMVEQTTRKVTLQENDLPRAMEARPCQEGCNIIVEAST